MARNWHNKHISTKWGIAIVGYMLVSVMLLIPVLGQQQNTQSEAAGGNSHSKSKQKPKSNQKQSPLICKGVSKCVESSKSCKGIIVPNGITDKNDKYYKKSTCLYEGNSGVKQGVCCNPYK